MTASPLDAAALLSGPRGRRLCLDLARLLDDEVQDAAFYAAYDLDPGAGTSVVMFGTGTGAARAARAASGGRRRRENCCAAPGTWAGVVRWGCGSSRTRSAGSGPR